MDPTAEPTDGDSTGAEPSEAVFVTPAVTAPEAADPQTAATQIVAPETATVATDAPETAAPEDADEDWDEDEDEDEDEDGWVIEELPAQESVFDRHRTLIVLGSIGAAVLIGVLAIVVAAVIQSGSTANVRVKVPAPASAGGLNRDYADESNPQFQAALAQFRQRYAASFATHISSYTAAIYTNAAAGQPATTANVGLLYLGFNSAGETINPANAVRIAVSHIETSFQSTTGTVRVSGLPGDTNAECVGSAVNGNPVAICVWATDETEAVIATLLPGTDTELASVLKRMQPDLVTG